MSAKNWPLNTIVEVEWRDSAAQNLGWTEKEDYLKHRHVGPIRSIGYLLKDEGGMLSLVQSMSATTDHVLTMITIPRESVVKMKRVKGLEN